MRDCPRAHHTSPHRFTPSSYHQVVVIYCRRQWQQQFGKYGSLYISLRFCLYWYLPQSSLFVCLCLKCNKFWPSRCEVTASRSQIDRSVSLVLFLIINLVNESRRRKSSELSSDLVFGSVLESKSDLERERALHENSLQIR